MPAIAGGAALTGASAITVEVGAEVAVAVPSAAVAVSTTCTLCPTSAEVRAYEAPGCGLIAEQVPPEHVSHWSAIVTAVASDHVPGVNVRVWPSWAIPASAGGVVPTGPAAVAVPVARLHATVLSNRHSDILDLNVLKGKTTVRRTGRLSVVKTIA
jgi:acetamidase/formamidase